MIAEVTILRSWLQVWPCFAAGVCAPLLGLLLARWFPFHFAAGIGHFVVWFFVGLILARKVPPKWGVPGWLAAVLTGATAGMCVGVLSFFFPWK